MKYVPNILTIIRILLVPIFPLIFFSNISHSTLYALIVFIIANITDFFDGYLARKFNIVSIVGIVLDPLADKLMLITTLVSLYIANYIPIFVLIIIFIKESCMVISGIILYFTKEKTVVPSNKFGKIATVVFAFAIFLTILMPKNPLSITIVFIAILLELIAWTSYANFYFKNLR